MTTSRLVAGTIFVPLPNLGRARRDADVESIAVTSSTDFRARRPVASKVTSFASSVASPNVRAGLRLPHAGPDDRRRVPQEGQRAEHRDEDARHRSEVETPPHGNLRTSASRTSASTAMSSAAGTSKSGKRSSMVDETRFEPGFLQMVEDGVHTLLEARLVGGDERLATGLMGHVAEELGVHGKMAALIDGLAEEVRPGLHVHVVPVADLHRVDADPFFLPQVRRVLG